MARLKLIHDCDPGTDDAVALLMLLASPDHFDLLGVTTVGGNVSLEKTTRNALQVLELVKRSDIPVFSGCAHSMSAFEMVDAAEIHGSSGLGNAILPQPTTLAQKKHGVDFIIDTLLASDEPIAILATGPLTNVAMAFKKNPDIRSKIKHLYIMGGAIGTGNITPSAEYNFFCDPHAAQIVVKSGVPMTIVGLDVTMKVEANAKRMADFLALKTPVGTFVHDMLESSSAYDMKSYEGCEGGHIHDACVVAYMLRPDLFQGKDFSMEIETNEGLCYGRSVVDWWGKSAKKPNVHMLHQVNAVGFFELLMEKLRYFN